MTAKPLLLDFDPILDRKHAHDNSKAVEERMRALLDDTWRRLSEGDISGMDAFVCGLKATRDALSPMRWQALVAEAASHPVRALIHEEPFTRHAFEKPRGYAGDAELLDLIYRDRAYSGEMTPRGARLHAWAGTQPACLSVQARREVLAQWIDSIAQERRKPRMMSIACGHLREAQRSEAVREGKIEEFVALDQDARSLAVVDREQRQHNVTTVASSFRRLLVDRQTWGTFDFMYAAGLYDYLPELAAQRLTASMFRMLRPGGLLLVANFAPELRDIGYMEAIMDWNLIYRDEQAVERLGALVPEALVGGREMFRDEPGNVVYLAIRKA
jgi:extracellular factor (EF) 3-hydroxypalmitic acid methyl ester biosynthesis protein